MDTNGRFPASIEELINRDWPCYGDECKEVIVSLAL